MPKLIDILKGKGYNPYRDANGRFASGSSEYGEPSKMLGGGQNVRQYGNLHTNAHPATVEGQHVAEDILYDKLDSRAEVRYDSVEGFVEDVHHKNPQLGRYLKQQLSRPHTAMEFRAGVVRALRAYNELGL